jgi:hypothetical protein
MRDSPARTLLATCRYANRPDRNVSFVGFVMRTAIMPTNTILNQEDLRRWRDCPRRFWLHRHPAVPGSTKAQAEPDDDAEAVAQAADPKILAPHTGSDQALRATFPQAAVIEAPLTPEAWDAAVARTSSLLNEGFLAGDADATEGRAILGACLRSNDGVQVSIDVLAPGAHGLRIFKLRHATVGNDADIDAVALWAHVAARVGLRIQSAGLMLIDTDFIYPGHGCYAGLFREADLSPVLGSRTIPHWLVAMRTCERENEPASPANASCRQRGECEFTAHCGIEAPKLKTDDPASLDIVGRELALELQAEGHVDLRTVPEERMPDGRRLRALRAIQNDMPVLHSNAAKVLRAQPYPRYTLRIDTIGFATPIWSGTRPYQVLPFQWTCDVETSPGKLQHMGYLADKSGDPRRAFAETLLHALGHHGPIMAYNAGFERNRIRELAHCFEDLATDLECVQARIVDMFQIARAHYYHPAMCGSWSFKSMCRAIAPDLRADQFEWEGETAPQVAFARSQLENLNAARSQALRQALLQHGLRQTEALRRMVTLFESATARR